MPTSYIPASQSRLVVRRQGHNVIKSWGIPKPTVLVDTREQQPLPLLANHPNWIGQEKRIVLKTGDYSVEGMESLLALERKSMVDVINCTNVARERFLANCSRLSKFRWKAILIEATYEDLKSDYGDYEVESLVHPNAVCGTLDAIEAKFGIPVITSSRDRDLATERAASWLSKHFTYWWLEKRRSGRVLQDDDGL
jgi:ERCC4-type nuclease